MQRQLDQVLDFHRRFDCHAASTPTARLPQGLAETRARLLDADGRPILRADGKVLTSDHYRPPVLAPILRPHEGATS